MPMPRFTAQICLLLASSVSSGAGLRFDFQGPGGHPDSVMLDRILIDGRPPAGAASVRTLSVGVREMIVHDPAPGEWSFTIADASSYYGFGERFDRLNHAHTILQNASRDVAEDKGSLTYQPIPFYMSLRGYGLWLDTTSEAVFDLNVSDPLHILVRLYDTRLRVVLFEGPAFPLILQRFTALTGRQQLPPYWAFAPWKSRDYHRSTEEVYEDIDRYRALGLPASVLLIDSPWATNYNTYEFNGKQFTDAAAMIARVHDEGYKLVLWHTPWLNRETAPPYEDGFADKLAPGPASNFAEAERLGYLVHRADGSTYIGRWWKGVGALIDFTNPAARKWWQGQIGKAIKLGADGFKDDDAEGAFLGDAIFASGEDQRLMRNRYAVEYNRAVAEALTERKGSDWVLFQRSGTVGNRQLPVFWSGDNDASFSQSNGLPTVVTAGLNAGMSGISLWISDLGGYNKSARTPGDAELFSRWTEYSALSPGMEVMSGMNLGPWDYGEDALRLFRRYSILHMSLFPYRYAAAMESARNGLPLMRALVLMHQDDREAREATAEYYFGPDLLVAPILSAVTQRALYLPEGTWIDYWSGRCLTGRQTISAAAPLDRIPLYVRYGTILPKIPEDVMTLVPQKDYQDRKVKTLDDRRVYELYPGKESRTLTDFESRRLAYEPAAGSLTITGAPANISIRWRFSHPSHVILNGHAVFEVAAAADGATIEFQHHGTSTLNWR
ncbi:Glycoside hydrolase family 31 [Candidatus Sulfopaludibacter sp. SbA3]|nr:Glycoside hydrolase family 31 [Candidatus Sulfopaludibacter sp. SbA3]